MTPPATSIQSLAVQPETRKENKSGHIHINDFIKRPSDHRSLKNATTFLPLKRYAVAPALAPVFFCIFQSFWQTRTLSQLPAGSPCGEHLSAHETIVLLLGSAHHHGSNAEPGTTQLPTLSAGIYSHTVLPVPFREQSRPCAVHSSFYLRPKTGHTLQTQRIQPIKKALPPRYEYPARVSCTDTLLNACQQHFAHAYLKAL